MASSTQGGSGSCSDKTVVDANPTPRRMFRLSEHLPPWATNVRRLAPPVLAAFLTFIFTVVKPLNRLAGQYAFLCNTSVILFFFPKGRVSQIIESNTTNFIGMLAGMAWTQGVLAVAAWCGKHRGKDSPDSRTVLALGLATLSMTSGFLRSYLPRLNVACRAAIFYPIFLLTAQQAITKYDKSMFMDLFYVAVFAYAFSTISGVLLSEHSSSAQLGSSIFSSLKTTCQLLPTSLGTVLEWEGSGPASPMSPVGVTSVHPAVTVMTERALEDQPVSATEPGARSRQQKLSRQLRAQLTAVRKTHDAYALDIVHSRHHPAALKPLIHTLGRIQRNALLGPTGHVPGERIRTALERTYASPMRTPVRTPMTAHSSLPSTPRRSQSGHFSISSVMDSPVPASEKKRMLGPPPRLSLHHSHLLSLQQDSPRSVHSFARGHPAQLSVSPVHLAQKLSLVATHTLQPRVSSGRSHAARTRLTSACNEVSQAIIAALHQASYRISLGCDWKRESRDDDLASIAKIKADLESALKRLERRLSGIIDVETGDERSGFSRTISRLSIKTVAFEDEMTSNDWLDDDDRFRLAFYMIALLDLAKDSGTLLDQAVHLHDTAHKARWILPAVIWPWSKLASDDLLPSVDREVPQEDSHVDCDKAEDLDFVHAVLREDKEVRPQEATRRWVDRLQGAWRSFWDRHGVVAARVFISKAFHQLKHSRHVHFSIKQTLGISMLSLPAFMPSGNSGRNWYEVSRGAWMVNSFMYVIEVTTGATLKVGLYRAIGTFIGALMAFIFTLIAGTNPYGLVVLATAAFVPISYGILFTKVAPMAIVTGITMPPVLFIRYLGQDYGHSDFRLAYDRFVDIVIGIVAAVLIGTWLWPIHARVRYFLAVADAVDQITEYYVLMSRDLLRPSLVYQINHKQYATVESAARHQISRARMLLDIQQQELSLLPRPIKLYSETIELLERLLELLYEVRTLRFSLPRQETVLDVLPIRRELVSAILVSLWAIGQSFRSRSPLPQHLPSARVPLGEVMEANDDYAQRVRAMRARENRRRQRWGDDDNNGNDEDGENESDAESDTEDPKVEGTSTELAVLYGMAENEALGEAINSIDELLAAARTLFGTKSFMDVGDGNVE